MNREDLKIGMVVYHEYDGPAYRYEITGIPDEGEEKVSAKCLSERDYRNGLLDIDLLHPYDEEALKKKAAELQAKVDAAKTAFEAAFEALRDVRDYHENGISRYSLQELDLLSLDELERAIDCGGWSSSSLWC
jgi:hypothetical protein